MLGIVCGGGGPVICPVAVATKKLTANAAASASVAAIRHAPMSTRIASTFGRIVSRLREGQWSNTNATQLPRSGTYFRIGRRRRRPGGGKSSGRRWSHTVDAAARLLNDRHSTASRGGSHEMSRVRMRSADALLPLPRRPVHQVHDGPARGLKISALQRALTS